MARLISQALIVVAILAPGNSWALDGKDWSEMSEFMQAMYVGGVIDAWRNYASIHEEYPGNTRTTAGLTFMRAYECLDAEMTYRQVRAMVAKWLENHPEQLKVSMASIVWTAVTDSCRKGK